MKSHTSNNSNAALVECRKCQSWGFDIAVFIVALIVLTAAMNSLHALDSGLSGSDEGSHFLNAYFIWSYLTELPWQNPMTYATDFYVHYPKISIGHWPPLYYGFLSIFFFVLPHAPYPFLIVNLIVGTLPALLIARVIRKILGLPWAVLAALTYVMTPIVLNNSVRLMLDQVLTGLCLLAALLWSAFAKRPSMKLGVAYATVTAAAILVKGNGWVLGVFPLFHIALTGRWQVLLNWRTYTSGVVALLIVGAWTVVTYKISSDGFNYSWGWDYFILATSTFLPALYANIGPLGVIALFLGILGSMTNKDMPELRELGITSIAMVLATILFHSMVPVDLDSRYMSSAIPFLIILIAIGFWLSAQRLGLSSPKHWIVIVFGIIILSIPGIEILNHRPARFDMQMDLVATQLHERPDSMVIVIDGNPGAEGALTAEVALRDSKRQNYVVRSSQLLAKSDFMGKRYNLLTDTPEGVLALLDDISCNAVVVSTGPYMAPKFAHSDLLISALQLPSSPFQLAQTYEHKRHNGYTFLYLRTSRVPLNLEKLKSVNFPEKAPK